MQIDIYCPFYNEKNNLERIMNYWKLLPIRKITFLDNGTTDGSLQCIQNRFHNVEVINNPDPGINDLNYLIFKNEAWKRSKGQVDFVLVCDFDEVIWSNDIIKSLENMKNNIGTIAKMLSFSVICKDEDRINSDQKNKLFHLQNNIKFNIKPGNFKRALFDPNKIESINFCPGGHFCKPIGEVNYFNSDIFFFHLSDLGVDHLIKKFERNAKRLSDVNKKYGLGTHYFSKADDIKSNFNKDYNEALTWNEIINQNLENFRQ